MRPSSLLGRSDKGSPVSPGPAVGMHHDQPHPERVQAVARGVYRDRYNVYPGVVQSHLRNDDAYLAENPWAVAPEVRAAILTEAVPDA